MPPMFEPKYDRKRDVVTDLTEEAKRRKLDSEQQNKEDIEDKPQPKDILDNLKDDQGPAVKEEKEEKEEIQTFLLNNGCHIPVLQFGTYKLKGRNFSVFSFIYFST